MAAHRPYTSIIAQMQSTLEHSAAKSGLSSNIGSRWWASHLAVSLIKGNVVTNAFGGCVISDPEKGWRILKGGHGSSG
jgi:hypothetical protein